MWCQPRRRLTNRCRTSVRSSVLAILARPDDPAAEALLHRREGFEIALLTPRDLAMVGWRVRTTDFARGTAVVGGRVVPMREISAVLTLLPSVETSHVTHVVADERPYVASEMHAFLLYWLGAMAFDGCPVFNPPAAPMLSSPAWDGARMRLAAARLRIPLQPLKRSDASDHDTFEISRASPTLLTVVGSTCVGTADAVLVRRALELARAAGTELLSIYFDGSSADARFVGADPWPDISTAAVADEVLALISRRRR
jgi:hypothetical protein